MELTIDQLIAALQKAREVLGGNSAVRMDALTLDETSQPYRTLIPMDTDEPVVIQAGMAVLNHAPGY